MSSGLIIGNKYGNLYYWGKFKFRSVCDVCGKKRNIVHEFSDKPYGIPPEEDRQYYHYGTECIKKIIK